MAAVQAKIRSQLKTNNQTSQTNYHNIQKQHRKRKDRAIIYKEDAHAIAHER